MLFKQRKKDIENKLREMNFPENKIKEIIKCKYDIISILTKSYIRFESQINTSYNFIKEDNAYIQKREIDYNENKKIEKNIHTKLPIITSKPSPQ